MYLFYEKSAINAQDRLREYDKSKEDRYTHSLSFQVVSIFNPHSNLLASLSSTDRMSFRLSDLEQATFPIVLSHEYSNIGIIFFFLLATKYCAVGFYDLDFLCFSNAERRSVAVISDDILLPSRVVLVLKKLDRGLSNWVVSKGHIDMFR